MPLADMSASNTPLSPLNQIPGEVHCARDYERLAAYFMSDAVMAYIAGGCSNDYTVAMNGRAFDETLIWPRLLGDVSNAHTALHLFGRSYLHPVMLAPVAYQTLVHPNGEIETARGAAAMDACMTVSTLAGKTIEEIASQSGEGRWFQLYFQPEWSATEDLVRRAEYAGYEALVVTLDAAIKLPSLRAQRLGFSMPEHVIAASLAKYPGSGQVPLARGQSRIFAGAMRFAPGWQDLARLIEMTKLPVIVKGVLRPDDACRLQSMGVAGQIVSNHGGRSLDGVPASLRVLPGIRSALGKDYPLLLDSGIRSGSDIFKALALGANAVMIGRLQVYALAVAGALGVAHMIRLLREELEVCMAQAGCATLADIGPAMIFKKTEEETRC